MTIFAIAIVALIAPMTAIAGFSTAIQFDEGYFKSYGEADDFAAVEWRDVYLGESVAGPYGPQGAGNHQNSEMYNADGSITPVDNTPIMYSEVYNETGIVVGGDGMQVGNREYLRVSDQGLGSSSHIVYETGTTRVYIPVDS